MSFPLSAQCAAEWAVGVSYKIVIVSITHNKQVCTWLPWLGPDPGVLEVGTFVNAHDNSSCQCQTPQHEQQQLLSFFVAQKKQSLLGTRRFVLPRQQQPLDVSAGHGAENPSQSAVKASTPTPLIFPRRSHAQFFLHVLPFLQSCWLLFALALFFSDLPWHNYLSHAIHHNFISHSPPCPLPCTLLPLLCVDHWEMPFLSLGSLSSLRCPGL